VLGSGAAEPLIVALATPAGHAATSLLRLSGAGCLAFARALCPGGPAWRPRRSALRRLLRADGALIDEALVVWMPGPRSFTGEDCLELSLHGNPILVAEALERAAELGASMARPGEFSRRALLNGRLDLLRAEGLAALITARSPLGLAAARGVGELHAQLERLRDVALDHAAALEARLDYPGEDLDGDADAVLGAGLRALADEARRWAGGWAVSRRRLEGARVLLEGPVNAGKSSLFNALVGSARAIVSDTPGTTRDLLERSVMVEGLEITFFDAAGERSDPDPIEAEGIARGRAMAAEVDLRLWLCRPEGPTPPPAPAGPERWLVMSHAPSPVETDLPVRFFVDSPSGAGVYALRSALRARLGEGAAAQASVLSQRQHSLLLAVAERLEASAEALEGWAGVAVAAEACTEALELLGELRGDDVREDVLDRLFSRFCIGK